MSEKEVLEFLKGLLSEGFHDGGIEVTAPAIEDDALLVDLNGAYFAIKAEAF